MEKNHAAAIMANIMIECHFKLISEDPDYRYKTKSGAQPYLKYKDNPVGYFNARYGYSTSVGKDLGNKKPNDGYTFRGRGFCQLTGRELYQRASKSLGVDFISNPELVLQKEYAFKIAVAFFMGWNGGFFSSPFRVLPKIMPNGSTDFVQSRLCINPGEVRNPTKFAKKLSDVRRFGNAYLKIFNIVL
ncbi:glycoside hydrolase family 19 protein [Ornithobacterium rhinotracheale]